MLAIKNAKIYTVTNGVIEKGTVLIDGDKIKAVGEKVRIPKGSDVIDATGKCVMPGMIDAHTHVSVMTSPLAQTELTDHNESSVPATPYVRALDAIYPYDAAVKTARSAGLTTVCSLPGSINVIGGTGVVIKLKQAETAEEMVVPALEQMKFAFGENPRNKYNERNMTPKTRMGVASVLRENLFNAKKYSDQLLKHGKDPSKPAPKPDFRLESMLKTVRGEAVCRIHCHRADDIASAVRIAKEFGLRYTLEHVTEGYMMLEFLKREDPVCVVGPITTAPKKTELVNKKLENIAILANAGLRVCLCMDCSYNEYMLPIEAGLAMAYGLSEEDAFKAVTIRPAEVLGIADRVGSIEAGKDADLAIFNGFPFENFSRCEKTVIDGVVYDNL